MLHIMKIAVGVQSIEHLYEINQMLALQHDGYPYTLTRFSPKKTAEILDGGSLYRVIKGFICCRQRIKDFVSGHRETGEECTYILLEPEIIKTATIAMRPFQGWRYLQPQDAPMDLTNQAAALQTTLPNKLRRDLEELGLI